LFGKPVAQEGGLQAVRSLEDHIVHVLGAETLDRWTVEVTYKMKQKKKKAVGSEMRFGVNTTAPFVGMKRDEGIEHPFAKQYFIRSASDRGTRLMVVQELAEESPCESPPEGKLTHVLSFEGEDDLERISATKGMVTRLKASIEGNAYKLGDFIIRVGKCKKGAVYRGLAMEVEYMPCCRVADGLAMIDALIPSINEDRGFVSTSDLRDALVFGTGPQFTVQHTALQITDLFNKVFA
ncbi:unnamed protein product, partial [Pylaiella littoralis]